MTRWIPLLIAAALVGCGGSTSAPSTGTEDSSGGPSGTEDVPAVGPEVTEEADVTGPTPEPDVLAEIEVEAEVGEPDTGPDAPPPECDETNDFWKCNDSDACTEDACIDGVCVHDPIAGCCGEDADCDDGVHCTVDECNLVKHECLHAFEDNHCCLDASDCDDGDGCTVDACVAHQCVVGAFTCPCTLNAECDDGNPCTADLCVGPTGDKACTNEPTLGGDATEPFDCCTWGKDCDDGDPATADFCGEDVGVCFALPLGCDVDTDCPAVSGCLVGSCVDGTCDWTAPHEGCCEEDADCVDLAAATVDTCVNQQCVSDTGTALPCATDDECPAAPCADLSCRAVAGRCHMVPTPGPGCCESVGDCPGPPACVAAVCDASLQCAEQPASGTHPLWQNDFPDVLALEQWLATADTSGASWQIDDLVAIAPAALYYGRVPQYDYDVGATAGTIQTPPIDLPDDAAALTLSWWAFLDIEPLSSRDLFDVVLIDGAGAEHVVYSKSEDGFSPLSWEQRVVDVTPYAPGPIAVRFAFDSVDGTNNEGLGVSVDDVEVTRSCP